MLEQFYFFRETEQKGREAAHTHPLSWFPLSTSHGGMFVTTVRDLYLLGRWVPGSLCVRAWGSELVMAHCPAVDKGALRTLLNCPETCSKQHSLWGLMSMRADLVPL